MHATGRAKPNVQGPPNYGECETLKRPETLEVHGHGEDGVDADRAALFLPTVRLVTLRKRRLTNRNEPH